MSKLKLKFNTQSALIPSPASIQDLNTQVKQLFGIKLPSYSYIDEDSELISVDVQLELNEAVRYLSQCSSELLIEEKATNSTLQFIEELPLLRSQITTDDGTDPKPAEKNQNFEKLSGSSEVLEQVKSEYSQNSEEINEFEELTEFSVVNQEKTDKNMVEKSGEREGVVVVDENDEKNEKDLSEETENRAEVTSERLGQGEVKVQMWTEFIAEVKNDRFDEDKKEIKVEMEEVKEEEFPEITIEKEEMEIDLEMIRSVIRGEIEMGRSQRIAVHDRVCSGCRVDPVVGALYKCARCYFYLCEKCEEQVMHKHPLLKLKEVQRTDRVTDMCHFICRELKHSDSQKVRAAVEKYNCDYEKALTQILGV